MDHIDPVFCKEDGILGFSNEDAEKIASELALVCYLDSNEPDAAFESADSSFNFEFDKMFFDDDFMAEYIARESISTNYGKLINYEKEIKMSGNAMSKSAGPEINLLPGTDGFSTSAPRKKDGQYYTRATLAFSDGQAIRILFYNPDKPEQKPKYPTNQVSFQIFLNKKDITGQLVKGGGKDYRPRQLGKIIGTLLKKNSERFQKKNAEIRAQKTEMESLDKEISGLDEQIVAKSNEASQVKERSVFLKKQHEDWKKKSETAAATKVEAEKKQKAIDDTIEETDAIDEQPQEQVTDTGITQAEPPPEEAAENKREIGSEYKDREGTTKLITHEIDGDLVSAVQQKEYVFSAYLRNGRWVNLPVEKKTLISEDDLKGAIAKSKDAYQIADDILNGNYDSQGPDKVDSLLDEIAEVIEDEDKLNQVADYYTNLLAKQFAPKPESATA